MKVLLAILGCVSLCSCALSPGARDSAFDDDQYVPLHPHYTGLGDPRSYMDKDDPNIQKLISSHYIQ